VSAEQSLRFPHAAETLRRTTTAASSFTLFMNCEEVETNTAAHEAPLMATKRTLKKPVLSQGLHAHLVLAGLKTLPYGKKLSKALAALEGDEDIDAQASALIADVELTAELLATFTTLSSLDVETCELVTDQFDGEEDLYPLNPQRNSGHSSARPPRTDSSTTLSRSWSTAVAPSSTRPPLSRVTRDSRGGPRTLISDHSGWV
jgi:hypothetical protein